MLRRFDYILLILMTKKQSSDGAPWVVQYGMPWRLSVISSCSCVVFLFSRWLGIGAGKWIFLRPLRGVCQIKNSPVG